MSRSEILAEIAQIYASTGIRPVNANYEVMSDSELQEVLDGLYDAVTIEKEEFKSWLHSQ